MPSHISGSSTLRFTGSSIPLEHLAEWISGIPADSKAKITVRVSPGDPREPTETGLTATWES